MPRDYYADERRDSSHQRDRDRYSNRRDAERAEMRQAPPPPEYPRYEQDYYMYGRDKQRSHEMQSHSRQYPPDKYRDERVYNEREEVADYDRGRERSKKKRKSKKRKLSKERTFREEHDDPNKSLVTAYDDISSDSDLPDSPTTDKQSNRRGYEAGRSRPKSPSSAIREYQKIKQRDHSNSPMINQASPSQSMSRSQKHLRGMSPEQMKRHDRAYGDSRRQEREQSPVHPPSPKKPRYRSRSPNSPHYRYVFLMALPCRMNEIESETCFTNHSLNIIDFSLK